jgi:hypothetical protein
VSPVTCYISFNLFSIFFTHLQICPWQHQLATFCLSGCFGAVRLTPPKTSFSTGGFFRSLRNLNVNCASFFGTCCYPAHWARPNPSRKTKDEDSLRSELYPPRAQLAVFHFLLAGCSIGWCDFHTGSWPILCLYTFRRKPDITKGWSDFVVFQVSGLVVTTRVHTNPGFRVCAFQTFDAIPGFGPPY